MIALCRMSHIWSL